MTKHIKADPEIGQLMDLQADDDQDWFNDHPQHFIRIRFLTDGDRAGLRAIGLSADGLNGTIVLDLRKGIQLRAPLRVMPFSQMWRALHGESYDDADFFSAAKELFRLCHGKAAGGKIFRDFKRRCAKGRGVS